jgi:hypothetical protein
MLYAICSRYHRPLTFDLTSLCDTFLLDDGIATTRGMRTAELKRALETARGGTFSDWLKGDVAPLVIVLLFSGGNIILFFFDLSRIIGATWRQEAVIVRVRIIKLGGSVIDDEVCEMAEPWVP